MGVTGTGVGLDCGCRRFRGSSFGMISLKLVFMAPSASELAELTGMNEDIVQDMARDGICAMIKLAELMVRTERAVT